MGPCGLHDTARGCSSSPGAERVTQPRARMRTRSDHNQSQYSLDGGGAAGQNDLNARFRAGIPLPERQWAAPQTPQPPALRAGHVPFAGLGYAGHMSDLVPRAGDSDRPRKLRASDQDRDAVLDVLSSAHASGRLDPTELDERQEATMATKFLAELPELIDDLPEGDELVARLRAEAGIDPGPSASGTAVAHRRKHIPPAKPGTGKPVYDVAVLGGSAKTIVAGTSKVETYALMGGSEIYLHEVMGPGVELRLTNISVMAGHDIYVPGGVRIIDNTVNFLAGNDIARNAQGDGSNGTLILDGFNLMAGHDVKLDPNWTPENR